MRILFAIILFLTIWTGPNASAQEDDLSGILAAQQDYERKPNPKNRQTLLSSLEQYSGPPKNETVTAYMIILANDGKTGRYSIVRESALATAEHLEPVASILPRQYLEARFIAATALFNEDQTPSAMLEMAHVQGLAGQQRDSTGGRPDWAYNLKNDAETWRLAMDAYYSTNDLTDVPTLDAARLVADYRSASAPIFRPETAGESVKLPFCSGEFVQKPEMKYRQKKANKGMFGALLVRFEFDSSGAVINPEVLSSVPANNFDDDVLRTIRKWKFRAASDQNPGETCRIERSNLIQRFSFNLSR